MAVITVKLGTPKPVETKRRLAMELTERAADILQIGHGEITVLFEELGRENYATGGELQSDRSDMEGMASRQAVEAFFRKPVKAKPKKEAAKSPRRR